MFRAPVTIAADGNSSRLALAMGLTKRTDRPMGVAVRTYFRTEHNFDDYMHSWLELWDGKPGESNLMPGYGWAFGLGNGTVNVGLGTVGTSAKSQKLNFREMLTKWLATTPEWGFRPEQFGVSGPPRADELQPAAALHAGAPPGGDSGGMVSPFNGEGIPYAMEAAEFAADAVVDARARGFGTDSAERALRVPGQVA